MLLLLLMPKGFHKHKILFDENMPQRKGLPLLNRQFDVKHVRDDFSLGTLEDPAVYELAVTEGRVLVTHNVKHFRPLAGTKADCGVIGVPDRLPLQQLDTKLSALLKQLTPNALRGKYVSLLRDE